MYSTIVWQDKTGPLRGVSETGVSITDVDVMTDLYTGHVAFLNKKLYRAFRR